MSPISIPNPLSPLFIEDKVSILVTVKSATFLVFFISATIVSTSAWVVSFILILSLGL